MRAGVAAGLVAVSVLLACGGDDGAPPDDGAVPFDPPTGGDEEGDTGPPPIIAGEATDICANAYSVGEGVHHGTLRARQSDLDGACGYGGPDAFFRLEVPRRSDVWLSARGVAYAPRVGVLGSPCAPAWRQQQLLCTEGVGGWVRDVAAGTSLVVSVGIAPDDPTIETAPPTEGADPLDFELTVQLRDVLDVGDLCAPVSRGRCGAGTGCLPDAGGGPATCQVLDADTCSTAQPLALAYGETELAIDRDTLQSDAHAHACGGDRHPERVYALSLPISDGAPTLTVRSGAPHVGFALRGSDCAPDSELACASPTPQPTAMTTSLPAAVGRPVLLFVELPVPSDAPQEGTEAGEEAPIVVTLELSPPG